MATVTTQERTNILKLVAGMFNAAPGATYLNEFTNAFVDLNKDLGALANALGQTGAFQSLYPSFLSAEEFANKFLDTLGLKANTEAQDWVKAKVTAGESYASVIFQALVAIDASTAADFKAAKDQLANKAAVAEYYSVEQNKSADDLAALQAVVAKVTNDAATVEAAKAGAAATAGQTFTLTAAANVQTAGVDEITGTSGNDTFRAVVAASLDSTDIINGAGGFDVLNIAAGGIAAAANQPVISGIERINNADAATTLDLRNVTGVEQVWTNTGAAAVATSRANLDITFGASGHAAGTAVVTQLAPTVSVTGDNDTLNLAVSNNGTAAAPTAITFTMQDSAGVAVAAGIEHINLTTVAGGQTAGNVQLAAFTNMQSLTVAGDGNVTLTLGAGAGSLKTLDASGNSGNVTVTLPDANIGTSLKAVFGAGDDRITITADASASAISVTGGQGGDAFIINGALGMAAAANTANLKENLITIEDFGTGKDSLNINALTGGAAAAVQNTVQVAVNGANATNLFDAATAAYTVAAGIAGEALIFEFDSNLYIAIDDGSGTLDAADSLIELVGVKFADLNATNFVG